MRNERRMHRRVPFHAFGSICWVAGNETAEVSGKVIDLSAYGMLVEARTAIPTKTHVTVKVSEFAYSGEATVVRSYRCLNRVRIGLHFGTLIPFYLDVKKELDATSAASRDRREASGIWMWDRAKTSGTAAKLLCLLIGHDFELARECIQIAFRCRRCDRVSNPDVTLL